MGPRRPVARELRGTRNWFSHAAPGPTSTVPRRSTGRRSGQRRRHRARRRARRAARLLLERLCLRRTQGASPTSSRMRRTRCRPTADRSCTARPPQARTRGSSARPGSSGGRAANFVRTMLRLAEEPGRGAASSRTSAAAPRTRVIWLLPLTSPSEPEPRNLAPGCGGRVHLGRVRGSHLRGSRSSLPRRSRSRRRSLPAPAPRPAYSVLRSERPGAPTLPHWRDGLRACLEAMG